MVRSLFEHCAEIWRPSTKVALDKFEALQKHAVKWIFMEDYEKYTPEIYQQKLQELGLLSIESRFKYFDLKLFFRIINSEVCIKLPEYLQFISPDELVEGNHTGAIVLVQLSRTVAPVSLVTLGSSCPEHLSVVTLGNSCPEHLFSVIWLD